MPVFVARERELTQLDRFLNLALAGQSQEVLTLARELGHPFSLADVLCYAGCMVSEMRRDAQALKENAEELARLADEKVPV
jgi:hypothetical protein